MIYTITFNPAVDYVVTADTFRTGKTNRTKTENIVFGGKGVNVSLLLHALNTKSIALGFIAGFTGKALREGVEKEGITTDFIEVENGFTRINLKLHAEEETELNGSGPEISENELKNFFEKLGCLDPAGYLGAFRQCAEVTAKRHLRTDCKACANKRRTAHCGCRRRFIIVYA